MIGLARAGRTPAELAREFGVTAQTITHWIGADGRDARRGKQPGGALSSAEREEIHRLRRQLRQVQLERDILAKGTARFAAKGDMTLTPSSSS